MNIANVVGTLALSALISIGSAANAMASEVGKVTGKVVFSNSSRTLPENAMMHVTLVDVSPHEGISTTIVARQSIANPPQDEMAFELQYDPAQIRADGTYAVQVRVMAQGEVMYMNTQPYQVITKGHPHSANVVLTPAN